MATGLPVGQKIDQDPTVCKGAPLGAQSAIAAASIVISTTRPVSPRSPRRRLEPQFGDRIRLCVLTEEITPEVVDEVLELTGSAERRRRLLPARAVVYCVLALCLFSSSDSAGPPGYRVVLRPDRETAAPAGRDRPAPAHQFGPHQSRQRLRDKPFQALFERRCDAQATPTTPGAFAFGLRLVAWDGTAVIQGLQRSGRRHANGTGQAVIGGEPVRDGTTGLLLLIAHPIRDKWEDRSLVHRDAQQDRVGDPFRIAVAPGRPAGSHRGPGTDKHSESRAHASGTRAHHGIRPVGHDQQYAHALGCCGPGPRREWSCASLAGRCAATRVADMAGGRDGRCHGRCQSRC
ncbi:transposase domain-containing protein [Streptomyces hawaiiensis]|uniref:Transposase IS4 N-terminal domain-containing protein n=1 Tax=Streptomyces hawaiiensis TaxID=67305 RepID=A0A6G5R6Y8_9ACTN|nr:hypothetical protein CEB94_00150 [Streptomyces hawaiiensis]